MLKAISSLIWVITTFLILYVGFYYSVYLKFPQLQFKKIIKSLKNKGKEKSNTFELLNLTLAGKIGVGSISGIALCIYKGGVGTIFWLWVSVFILASLTYVETKLGIKYREKIKEEYIGGPSFYIEKGLGKKKLAKIYSILIIITYLFAFISIQSNTIVISIENTFNLNRILIVILLIAITYISIYKGIKTISKLTSFLVPIMGSLYIIIGIIVIVNNWSGTLLILENIVKEAFNIQGLKTAIIVPIVIGIERGVFSNEAGIGTTAMISALSNNSNQETQANVQILGTFFTSLVVCTITSLIILTSSYETLNLSNINGIEIVSYALFEHFGYIGIVILTLIIFLFAFSTIVTSYYYGEINIKYLFHNKSNAILKIIVIIVIVYSAFISPSTLWDAIDIIIALIALINIYAMYKLRKNLK